jgi:hypothetical protein
MTRSIFTIDEEDEGMTVMSSMVSKGISCDNSGFYAMGSQAEYNGGGQHSLFQDPNLIKLEISENKLRK